MVYEFHLSERRQSLHSFLTFLSLAFLSLFASWTIADFYQ
jgi:hypothetical protein